MEVIPEAAALIGAGLTTFLVGAVKQVAGEHVYDRVAILATILVGIAVSILIYSAGLIENATLPRMVLAGLVIALAASGGRSHLAGVR